jgi:hypothetical protein
LIWREWMRWRWGAGARKAPSITASRLPSPLSFAAAGLTLVLTSAGSLHSSSRPFTIPKAKLTGLRVFPSAPLSGAGVPVPSPLRRLLRGADGPADPRARLPATEGVGEGASCGGMDGGDGGVERGPGLEGQVEWGPRPWVETQSGGERHGTIFLSCLGWSGIKFPREQT